MTDSSESTSSEDSAAPVPSESANDDLESNLVAIPELDGGKEEKCGNNWAGKVHNILKANSIDEENKAWVLSNFHRWDTLAGVEQSDLAVKKVKILKSELAEVFEDFRSHRDSILDSFTAAGLPQVVTNVSAVTSQIANGVESFAEFMNSDKIIADFNQEDVDKMRKSLSSRESGDEGIPECTGIDSEPESIEKEIEEILKDLNLHDEAVEEVLQNFEKFTDLNSGLEECEELTKKQMKLLAEKLEPTFRKMKSNQKSGETPGVMKELEVLTLSEEAFDWIRSWLESCESSNQPLDLNQVDMCEDLSKRQMIQVKETLKVFFKIDENANEQQKTLNSAELFSRALQEILDSRPDIKDPERSWVVDNIFSFEKLDDLDENEDLTRKQISFLKASLENAFNDYCAGKRNVPREIAMTFVHGDAQKPIEIILDDDPAGGIKESTSNKVDFRSAAVQDRREVNIIPLVLFGSNLQEGLTVEKNFIAQEGIDYLCNMVPSDFLDVTPVCYKTVSNGLVIDFETLDKINIKCVGLFGPLAAVIKNLETHASESDMMKLKSEETVWKTGLYLIDTQRQTKFIIYYSEDDSNFDAVKKDSRAVHYLRYMSQLCNNVVMCIDEKYANRLAVEDETVVVKSDRRSRYKLTKEEVQLENVATKSLGPIHWDKVDAATLHSSQDSLVAVCYRQTHASSSDSNMSRMGSMLDLKPLLDNLEILDYDKVDPMFKSEYLESFSRDDFVKIERSVDENLERIQSDMEDRARHLVLVSSALYFIQSECLKMFKIVKKYLIENPLKSDNLWEKRVDISCCDLRNLFSSSSQEEIRARMNSEKHKILQKYLLWDVLVNSKQSVSPDIDLNDFESVTYEILYEKAKKLFASWRSAVFGVDSYIKAEQTKAEDRIDFKNTNERFELCVSMLINSVCETIKPFTNTPLFETFCGKQNKEDLQTQKQDMFSSKISEKFHDLMKLKSYEADEKQESKLKGAIKAVYRNKKRYPSFYYCNYTVTVNEPCKTSLDFYQLALSRAEHYRLTSSRDLLLNNKEIELHEIGSLRIEDHNAVVAIYPIENSKILMIFNEQAGYSKTIVYNLSNTSKPHHEMSFGKPVSDSCFENKSRVLALHSEKDPGVIQLVKFAEEYVSAVKLKSVDLNKKLGVEDQFSFCLQPNGKFLWFLHDGRLRQIDYKSSTLRKAIKIDCKTAKIECTPDGNAILVMPGKGCMIPVMTESGNILNKIEVVSRDLYMFSMCNQMLSIQRTGSIFLVEEIIVTGSQHETRLNRKGLNSKQADENHHVPEKRESHWINYIYWMYTKFPCNDLLSSDQQMLHFWISTANEDEVLQQKISKEVNSLFNKLKLTRKPMDFVKVHSEKLRLSTSDFADMDCHSQLLGNFTKKLITFVPLQVARCKSNEFYILDDGRPVSMDSVNVTFDLIEKINFGFYESIFNAWTGDIKVISSMGKQTTGKSFTLNHLTGSSFNIAGTRCTDGCWMTVKEQEDCLYVILDFEGLGSFERTEQDDMLLSLFNSSISTITIFKTGMRLDRDVDKMFNKINMGSDQLKGNNKVFKGKFLIVINDVAEQDVEDTPREFEEKISNIVSKSENNFIKKLYNSDFEIMAFPAFESKDYYENMDALLHIIRSEIEPIFKTGNEFVSTMKLLMAKLATNDFSPLDRQQIDERVRFLRCMMEPAIQFGQTSDDEPKKKELDLKCLDNASLKIPTEKEIELASVGTIALNDFEIIFRPDQLEDTLLRFLAIMELTSDNFLNWREGLQNYLAETISFRFERVETWLEENLRKWKESENSEYDDIINVMLENLENKKLNFLQTYKFCDEKCGKCFLKCTQAVNHRGTHKCSIPDHRCVASCEFCETDKLRCKLPYGHGGKHVCGEISHVCSEPCRFNVLNDCVGECLKMMGHDGDHECSEKRHPCKEVCTLKGCEGRCMIECEVNHSVHKCTKEQCVGKCSVKSCSNKCSSIDHFHGNEVSRIFREEQKDANEFFFLLDDGITGYNCEEHFCGKEHHCGFECEHEGFCNVWTEKEVKNETFEGERDTFTYSLKFVEKGQKLPCRQKLEPFSTKHEGEHSCSKESHICMTKCPTCENICDKPINHVMSGDVLHHAHHGNMRKCFFVANQDNIEVGNHKYKVGEQAVAEMCHIFCNTLGRGHSHIVECDSEDPKSCMYSAKEDGRRHETMRYQPNPDIPKDELTHDSYWASIGFEDPCQDLDVEEFEKCPAFCTAETHEDDEETSFCEMPMWHDPVNSLAVVGRASGFLTRDGHVFPCSHPTGVYHFVLCLDDSGSMTGPPWQSLVQAVHEFVMIRLATTSSDRISIAIHNHQTRVAAEFQLMSSFSPSWLTFLGGENDFSLALRVADGIIGRHLDKNIKPVLVFMSDGIWNNGEIEMDQITRKYRVANGLEIYTLGFGDIWFDKLRELARVGKGQFIEAVNGIELKTAFVEISAKHPATIGVSF